MFGKAELYGLVKEGSIGLGIQSMFGEFGVKLGLVVKSDSSAAIGMSRRRGLGKALHIDVNDLWLQEKVSGGVIKHGRGDGC